MEFVLTVDVLGVCQSQCQFLVSGRPPKELGMRDPSRLDSGDKLFYQVFSAYDIPEHDAIFCINLQI